MLTAQSKCKLQLANACRRLRNCGHGFRNRLHQLWRGSNDKTAARIYVGLLSAEYEALDPQKNMSQANQELYRTIGKKLKDWTDIGSREIPEWTDLCSLESGLLRLLPGDALKAKLPLVQERLRELIGAQDYAVYEKIVPPAEKLGNDTLREYLMQLINRVHLD